MLLKEYCEKELQNNEEAVFRRFIEAFNSRERCDENSMEYVELALYKLVMNNNPCAIALYAYGCVRCLCEDFFSEGFILERMLCSTTALEEFKKIVDEAHGKCEKERRRCIDWLIDGAIEHSCVECGSHFPKEFDVIQLEPQNYILKKYTGKAEKVTIPQGINTIWRAAFSESQTIELFIPESVSYIHRMVFINCPTLEKIIVGESNPFYYEENGFIIDKKEREIIKASKRSQIPRSAKRIGSFSFYCSELEEICIPKNIEHIDLAAFVDCEKLKRIIIQNKKTSIDTAGFWYPNDVTIICEKDSPTAEAVRKEIGMKKIRLELI